MSGFNARRAQERLRAKGLYALPVDGDFGPASWAGLLAATAGRKVVTALDRQLGAAMALECPAHGIDSALEIVHFVAQGATETGGFARLVENLNYSASRLCVVWPSRFPSVSAAGPFANNPEALANKVYGGRASLGNREPGDGWRFRGRGLFQLTGRYNYAEREEDTGVPLLDQPDLAADPATSVKIACKYWVKRSMGEAAARDDLPTVRRLLNGGANGLDEARVYLLRAKAVLL